MAAICYFCDKESTYPCPKIAINKSQHTRTPIVDFVRNFLGDFHSSRNIDDESNCICFECLNQIDEYDRMRQQVSDQESKLRDLLLATEVKFCANREPVEIEKNGASCSRNGIVLANYSK